MADIPPDAMAIARACADLMYAEDDASKLLGIEIGEVSPGCATAHMTVTSGMVNGHDICHGGYIFTLADSAFAFACNTYGRVTVAAGASIEFVRSARLGDRLLAAASESHRGGRSGVYDVRVTDQQDRLIALFRGRSATLKETFPIPS